MPEPEIRCPICLSAWGGEVRVLAEQRPFTAYDCDVCGRFNIVFQLVADLNAALSQGYGYRGQPGMVLKNQHRSALIREVREQYDRHEAAYMLTPAEVVRIAESEHFPTPAEQAANIVRYIGDHVRREGEPMAKPPLFFSMVGAPTPLAAAELLSELKDRNLVKGHVNIAATIGGPKQHSVAGVDPATARVGNLIRVFDVSGEVMIGAWAMDEQLRRRLEAVPPSQDTFRCRSSRKEISAERPKSPRPPPTRLVFRRKSDGEGAYLIASDSETEDAVKRERGFILFRQ